MTVMSFVILGLWLLLTERQGLIRVLHHKRLCTILGVTSALGTIAWFFASALHNAAYVAAVAQVQIIFTLALSHYWFNEPVRRIELAGIAVILVGVILFRSV
jgi:drug/metabolite transporter (DMT)-like permease